MREIVDEFYDAVRKGNVPALEAVIAEDFFLICPAQNNVLSGVYRGKSRFFEAVLPHVFGCVKPRKSAFAPSIRSLLRRGKYVAVAQNDGWRLPASGMIRSHSHLQDPRGANCRTDRGV